MAASSFVGEKERHTLETLLYCPMTLRQIFRAKVLAAFLLSMAVSLASFLVMCLVLEIEALALLGTLLLPGVNWLMMLFLLAPAVSMVAVTLIVRGSAKAKSVEESQQRAVFLVIPVVLLIVGQFTGVMLLSPWILLGWPPSVLWRLSCFSKGLWQGSHTSACWGEPLLPQKRQRKGQRLCPLALSPFCALGRRRICFENLVNFYPTGSRSSWPCPGGW